MTIRHAPLTAGARRALLALLATALLLGALPPATAPAQITRPTIVLVHGAFADGSSWNAVTERLQRRGYRVVAFANPLRSLSGDSAHLATTLASITGPIVLAAHSYGGAVITNAAAGNANVRALVYANAFVPAVGETVNELAARFPGSQLLGALLPPVPFTQPDGTVAADLYIDPARYRSVFLGRTVSARRAAVLAAAQRPASSTTGSEPSGAAAWTTIPSWYVVGTRDRVIPSAAQRFMATRADATITTVSSAHVSPITRPAAVVAAIVRAVRATD